MKERKWLGAVVLALAAAQVAHADDPSLTGDWLADLKCEGVAGPALDPGTPGRKIKEERKLRLLIEQGAADDVLMGEVAHLAPYSLDVILFDPASSDDLVGVWCGFMNPTTQDGRKGQGSLGPFLFSFPPISLAAIFRTQPPPPYAADEVDLGDSTMHITTWELTAPDKQGCDAKLEMEGALLLPGGRPLDSDEIVGSGAFMSCKIKAKRCPSTVELPPFCSYSP